MTLAHCVLVQKIHEYQGVKTWICVIVSGVSSKSVMSWSDAPKLAVLPTPQVDPTLQVPGLFDERKSV